MMPKQRTEEQFPLLLLLVGDQEPSQTNRRFFTRGRFDGIASGATAIITEWPNYLSSCWVTALICGVTLFIISILLTSCVSFHYNHRLPRCVSSYQLDNKTVHLVHSPSPWTPNQLELIDNITHAFPNYTIHIIKIRSRFLKDNEIEYEPTPPEPNKTKSTMILKALLPKKMRTIDDLLTRHPRILVTHQTYEQIFANTPLFLDWISLNHQMRIFAVRVLQMWQFGGVSFDLMEFKVQPPKRFKNSTNFAEKKMEKFVRHACEKYEKLKPEAVSIDHFGLHMECQTPCHYFFEKTFGKLKKATDKATPRGLLKGLVYKFCVDGVIDKEFCHFKNVVLL